MISSKYSFRTEEATLVMPQEGTQKYLIESTHPINYGNRINCMSKKAVSITIQPDEDQPYCRFVTVQVIHPDFKFSDGSYAMQDIIKRVASAYFKLYLKMSCSGEILGILNISEIQNTWEKEKEFISNMYKGSQVERFILKTDAIFNSEKEIIKEILLYHNYGGLIKPLYRKYSSDSFEKISQPLITKYGRVAVTEEFLLQAEKETGDIQLQLQAHHPESKEYVSINGTYTFTGQKDSWLEQAVISCIEKYGRQEYHSTTHIIKKS